MFCNSTITDLFLFCVYTTYFTLPLPSYNLYQIEQEMGSFSFKVSFNEPYDSKQDMDDSLLIYLSHIYTI